MATEQNKVNTEDRKPTVQKAPSTTFDERTSAIQPFVTSDGKQDNGAQNISEPEGAEGTTSRDSDKPKNPVK